MADPEASGLESGSLTPEARGASRSIAVSELHGRDAYRLLTSLVIPRPIAWISTMAADGTPNLAPFSFFNLVTGRPLTIMFASGQRQAGRRRAMRHKDVVCLRALGIKRDGLE